jgi:hypothetical protein
LLCTGFEYGHHGNLASSIPLWLLVGGILRSPVRDLHFCRRDWHFFGLLTRPDAAHVPGRDRLEGRQGEVNMTAKIVAIIPMMALALATTTAVAQPTMHRSARSDQGSLITASNPYVGDGTNPSYLHNQQQLRNEEPGYSIGTGDARVSGN